MHVVPALGKEEISICENFTLSISKLVRNYSSVTMFIHMQMENGWEKWKPIIILKLLE